MGTELGNDRWVLSEGDYVYLLKGLSFWSKNKTTIGMAQSVEILLTDRILGLYLTKFLLSYFYKCSFCDIA